MLRILRSWLGRCILPYALSLVSAGGAVTTWSFNEVADRLAADSGPAQLSYYDPDVSGWGPGLTTFARASEFGLPALPGGDAEVMFVPATTQRQGYRVTHLAAPNGVHAPGGLVSNYSLVFDLFWPSSSDALWRSLYQTDPDNANDGDFFVQNQVSGGIGIAGNYLGKVTAGQWHRIVVVVRAADGEGQMHKYIDGVFVGGQGTTGSPISSRWALNPTFLLFADESGDTAPGCVSSVAFFDRNITMTEAVALGGPHAAGALTPGPASPGRSPFNRRAGLIGHRGESCCAPENTIASINAAFDRGAVACEVDIRLSADGVAVLMHDSTVDRTTDGTGNAASLTVAQLKTLDAGSWFSAAFAGERVPTLAEALQAAAGRGRLLLDTKVTGMGAAIHQALIEAGADATALWPWPGDSPAYSADFQAHIPGLQSVAGGVPGNFSTATFDALRAQGIVGFDVGQGSVTRAFVEAAHANGMFVSAYTILDPIQAERLINMDIDMFETDFVGAVGALLPPYDIDFFDPDPIAYGSVLGPTQLNATASVPGTFLYDPPPGTLLPPGTHDLTASFAPDDQEQYDPRTCTVQIRVLPPPPQSFQDWAASFGIPAVPDANPDNDPFSDLFEYVQAGNPLTPDGDLLRATVEVADPAIGEHGVLTLRLSRRLLGVRVVLQKSFELGRWTDMYDFTADTSLSSPLLLDVVDHGTHYQLRLMDPATVAANGGRAFYRLLVELGGASLLRRNLLANPGAEDNRPGADAGENLAIAGWTDPSSYVTAQKFNGFAIDNAGTGGVPPPPEFGEVYFYGGTGWSSAAGSARLTQTIDVAALGARIDALEITFGLSGFFGGWAGQEDTASLTLIFRDPNAGSLGSAVIGAPTAAQRGNRSGFLFFETNGPVPPGTRVIEVVLTFAKAAGGGDNDASADNLSLILSD